MKVFLYGNLAEAIGREIDVAVPSGATVGAVRAALVEAYPAAAAILARGGVRACIGDVISSDDAIRCDGDELAFFPPLSGG